MAGKRKYSADYYQEHRDRLLETSKKWQHEHREGRREYENKYRENHYEEELEKERKHYLNYKDNINERRRKHWPDSGHRESRWQRIGINITLEEYNLMLAEQDGLCAICREKDGKRMLSVDHDHATGEVRGLLCQKCNAALGFLGDNALIIESALRYIRGE